MLMWHTSSWEDYLYWQENDRDIVKKINSLLKDTLRNPFSGLGKPEPLVGNYKGFWSRRINQEHRLIYKIEDQRIIVASCRFHY
ncbi:MAG: Txe/YoeB family addiction module toxin [Saprospiraceae bacterium]